MAKRTTTLGGTTALANVGTVFPSATRTANVASVSMIKPDGVKGIIAVLNVTAASGTGGLKLQYFVVDGISGNKSQINATSTAVTAVGTYSYILYPGASSGGTQTSGIPLPQKFEIDVLHSDSSNYTYSVSYQYV